MSRWSTSSEHALTLIVQILPEKIGELRRVLAQIDAEAEHGILRAQDDALFPFGDLKSLHFARFVILERREDGPDRPRLLLFATDYDGSPQLHIDELSVRAGAGLDRVFEHCRGYPPAEHRTSGARRAFLRRNMRGYGAFYVGARERTVPQIHLEEALRLEMQQILDRESETSRDVHALCGLVRAGVEKGRVVSLPDRVPRAPSPVFELIHDGKVAAIVLLLALGPLAVLLGLKAYGLFTPPFGGTSLGWVSSWLVGEVVLVTFLVGMLRYVEETERPPQAAVGSPSDPSVIRREDDRLQRPMTILNDVKAGWFRLTLLRVVLALVDFRARRIFYDVPLRGIATIHFGRWLIVREQRRLLFMSNYDGAWESYIGAFVEKGGDGINAIWGQSVGMPKTRWLFRGGVEDEQAFKVSVYTNQIPTQVWYSAYPKLSVQRIRDNTEARRGLSARLSPQGMREWLRLL